MARGSSYKVVSWKVNLEIPTSCGAVATRSMKKAVVVTALLLLTAGFAFAGEEFHVDLEVDAAYALVSGVYVVPSLAFTYQPGLFGVGAELFGQFGGMFFTMDPTQFYLLNDGYVATTGFNLNVDFVPRATPLDESQLEGYDPVSTIVLSRNPRLDHCRGERLSGADGPDDPVLTLGRRP